MKNQRKSTVDNGALSFFCKWKGGDEMAYFSKEFTEDIILPDGSAATSVYEVERYLKRHNLALSGDYSDAYLQNVRYRQEQDERRELFAEFLRNYKKSVWQD